MRVLRNDHHSSKYEYSSILGPQSRVERVHLQKNTKTSLEEATQGQIYQCGILVFSQADH